MKIKQTLVLFLAITAAAVISAFAITRQRQKTVATSGQNMFLVNGVVRDVDLTARSIRIQHEEIPGYMPAMTMPFSIKQPALLAGLKAGDAVRFRLMVTENDSWIETLDITGKENRTSNSILSQKTSIAEVEEIQVGEALPDFTLTDQNGQSVRMNNFAGKAVLVTFIYTRCPLPNYCPLLSKNFAALQGRLQKMVPGQFHLFSISIDPEHDSPEVLKQYASLYTKDSSDWTFATADRVQIDNIASQLGLTHQPDNGFIAHDLRTALISPDGKLVHIWKSNAWTPYEVQRKVAEVLGKPMS